MSRRSAACSTPVSARLVAIAVAALCLLGVTAWWVPAPAGAVQASQPRLVSAVPAAGTPDINDGRVFAIAQVGRQMILGGNFTSVSPANDQNTTYPLANAFAFDAATGEIDHTGFRPAVNGKVATVIPGPRANEVYLGGSFTTVDGRSMRVALLNTRTGKLVASWQPSHLSGAVNKLVLANGKLFVAGNFTTAGGKPHRGLVALAPLTGQVRSYVNLTFIGHHNYGQNCDPAKQTCANGTQGVKSIDINPAGTRLVAIGDFTSVSGHRRDQIAMIDLGRSAASVDSHWATLAYTASCFYDSFDSYVREVQFAPNGSYFVVTATGGIGTNSDGTSSSCDAASRFETSATGGDIRPTWIDSTGEDSLWSLAITGTAVYVGGHQRWVNNPLGNNVASPGSIPRPGIAALSPINGLPLSWNPGRNPRGAGCFAMLATPTGLWIGSDTNYIGNRRYLRQKVAFFPLTGGRRLPAEATPALPGRVFLAGATASGAPDPDRLAFREFDGKTAGSELPLSTGVSWGSVHGAFTVDGRVIYGGSDGNLYARSFDGTSFGPEVELDPYDDPTWDGVETGSGQTYQGQPTTLLSEIPSVTSMFFSAGRLFYTISGDAVMHWRWFEPESGAVGADEFTVSGGMDVSDVAGAFVARHRLYYADQGNGELWSVHWNGSAATGASTLVNASTDWASRGLFLLANSTNPTPTPTAAFTVQCGHSATCRFQASPWVDPDGGVVKYRWKFGASKFSAASTSTARSHRYVVNGSHRVTLRVVDTAGSQASSSKTVRVNAPVAKIRFIGASKASGAGRKLTVRVPRVASAHDALLLVDSYPSTSVRATVPSGWRLVGRTRRNSLTTAVYVQVAARHRVPHSVAVRYSRAVRSRLAIAVYRHTATTPIERSAVAVAIARSTKRHRAPTLRHLMPGSWVVGVWTARSKHPAGWRLPHGIKKRLVVPGRVGLAVADSGRARRGTYYLGSARTSRPVRSASQWAIALSPALR